MNKILVKSNDNFTELINEYRKAFINYDIQKPQPNDKILIPLLELSEYIFQAKKNGLNNKEQCSYAGSVLVFSSLKEMGLKYGSYVNKINNIYLAGIKLANAIWRELDNIKDSSSKLSHDDFKEITKMLSDKILLQKNLS